MREEQKTDYNNGGHNFVIFHKKRWRGGEKRADSVLMTSSCGIQYEEMEKEERIELTLY